MLSDALHTVAKLQGSLQGKQVDLASVPGMVESTLKRLKELKEDTDTTTWFKDHSTVFTDPAQLGEKIINVYLLPSMVVCKKCNLMKSKVFHSLILTQKAQNLSGSFFADLCLCSIRGVLCSKFSLLC